VEVPVKPPLRTGSPCSSRIYKVPCISGEHTPQEGRHLDYAGGCLLHVVYLDGPHSAVKGDQLHVVTEAVEARDDGEGAVLALP